MFSSTAQALTGRPRALVVGTDPRVRRSLAGLVEAAGVAEVVGAAAGAIGALDLLAAERPDLVLLDLDRPDAGAWLDLVARLRRTSPHCSVVVLGSASTLRPLALAAGADAYIPKTDAPEAIRDAIAELHVEEETRP